MPLRLPDRLPAIDILKRENIFVMDYSRAHNQDIRPLKLVVLNLMPLKITTETDLIRLLSNTPLQIEISFMKLRSHTPKNTPVEHMRMFYKDFDTLGQGNFDGMIVTGAPVEKLEFEQVEYWQELMPIFDWARKHVTSTLYICWAALAGLYHFYGVRKQLRAHKLTGIFSQRVLEPELPIFRGFDDTFNMPHSRYAEPAAADIEATPELTAIASSPESGISMVMARGGREFFIMGHPEYSSHTLDQEYHRDLLKMDNAPMPRHYYRNDNPHCGPVVTWRAHANLLFTNWINYYVYQETPYDISQIK